MNVMELLAYSYNIIKSKIFKEMRNYLWCIRLSILTMLHAVIITDNANSKLKKCCKEYEPLLQNETAVNECFNKYCDFDTLSQTNVTIFYQLH